MNHIHMVEAYAKDILQWLWKLIFFTAVNIMSVDSALLPEQPSQKFDPMSFTALVPISVIEITNVYMHMTILVE